MSRRLQHAIARFLLPLLLLSTTPSWVSTAVAQAPELPGHLHAASNDRKDRPTELQERRTPASRTFKNPDGSLSTEVFSKPIHYMDRSGQLQPIQNAIVADSGGGLLRNAANRYTVTFKNRLGTEFLGFEYRGRSIHMDLDGARPQTARWLGDRLTYGEALDQVDLTYTVGNDYVKEEIILKSPDAPDSFSFTMRLSGITAEESDRGALRFRNDQTGEPLFAIPQMFMRDAAGALSTAVEVESKQTGNSLRLNISPDPAWLGDPARSYPVVVDPTIVLEPDFAGGLDTTIANAEGLEDLNLGFDSALAVGSAYSSLLKFDLSAIPRASVIESAALKLSSLSTPPNVNTTGIPAPDRAPALSLSAYTSSLQAATYSVAYTFVTPVGETLGSPLGSITLTDGQNYRGIDVRVDAFPAGVTGLKVYLAPAGGVLRLAATSERTDVTLISLPAGDAAPIPVVPITAPLLNVSTLSGSLSAINYSAVYTYVTSQGETQASPAATITATSARGVDVNVGAFPPGVTAVKVYFGTPDSERFSKSITTAATPTVTVTAMPTSTAALPPGYAVRYVATPVRAPQAAATAAPAGAPGFAAGFYHVRYTYLNSLGETPASAAQAVSLADGQALQVTVGKLPVGVASANVYVGLVSENTSKLGNIPASATSTAQTFGTPPASMATPAPLQAPAVLPDPASPPSVERFASTTPFVAGTYSIAYSFFGPNGETKSSPAASATLIAGDYVKVTANDALPAGATGIRVYLGLQDPLNSQDEPMYLVGSQPAVPADFAPPSVEVRVPAGYHNVAPPTASTYVAPYAPAVKALALTTPTRLQAATYYLRYTWIYQDKESLPSSQAAVTIAAGQAIEVAGAAPPVGTRGMRVYMSRASTSLWLVATSMGNRTVVTGDIAAPVAPAVNTTQLSAPAASTISLSALPAGTYHMAYTWTSQTGESAPSPAASVPTKAGQTIQVLLQNFPAGATGANLYLGIDPAYLRLVRGITGTTAAVAALPAAQAMALATTAKGTDSPAAPGNAPILEAATPSNLAAGKYSVRYTFTNSLMETPPSVAASVTVQAGQAVTVTVPPLIHGMTAAKVYAGPLGAERLIAQDVKPGVPVQITAIPSTTALVPQSGTAIPLPPVVTAVATAGGALRGDTYTSYSFYGAAMESLRSPEVYRSFASTNGSAEVTTAPVPAWASGARVYGGKAPGEGRLVAEVPAPSGSQAKVTVTRTAPSGIAVSAVTTPWTELDATWLRASANTPWFDRGGDYNREAAVLSLGGGATVTGDLTGLVRAWADGSVPNRGIMLRSQGSTVDFASSDHAEAALRPVLTITYRERQGSPSVTLTAPAPGTSVSGEIPMSAMVTTPDPGTMITRVDFYANGALIGSDSTAPYQLTWSSANLPGGEYTLSAKAYDQWGREGVSDWAPALTDSFEDQSGVDGGATTAMPDTERGLMTLPVVRTPIEVIGVAASSELRAESYPAENLLDGKPDTYWRSAGQPLASATESVRLDLNAAVTSASLTIRPRNAKDDLTVKLQAIDSNGDVIKESYLTVLDAETKPVSVTSTRSFKMVRLVFTNLRKDLASGLYHADVAEVAGASVKLAAVNSYRATYEASNAIDGSRATHWVSVGQSSPTGQEYLELRLASGTNALYIKPRTPGVTATIATYRGEYQGWEPVLSIASLDEGFYPLPDGVKADFLRIYLTNLVGMAGPGAPATFFGGLDEVVPYSMTLQQQNALVESRTITLPTPVTDLLLEAEDSQPPGSSINYTVYDGVLWHAAIPGIPLTLTVPTATLRVRAVLTSASPEAVPTLTAWRLFTRATHTVQLVTGVDTIAPTAELIVPSAPWVAGTVVLKVATWDNVGVTKVELYADNDQVPVVVSEVAPFDLTLDTTRLKPGAHLLWVKAYDGAANASTADLPTTTYDAFTDTFADSNRVDQELTSSAVFGGAILSTPVRQEAEVSVSGTVTSTIPAGPGFIRVSADVSSNPAGCGGTIQVKYSTSVAASDKLAVGECRDLQITYGTKSTAYDHSVVFTQGSAGGTYTGVISYAPRMAAAKPYTDTEIVSLPTVTSGSLAGVLVKATVSKPTGTDIRFFASANNGETWQAVQLDEYMAFTHSGNHLRLKAELVSAAGSTYSYKNLTPQLLDWSAQVRQYLPSGGITISQISPPGRVTATLAGTQSTVSWEGSPTPGATYDVHRSTQPHPEGNSYLVASGLRGTTLVEKATNNLLKNGSFESVVSTTSISSWSGGYHSHYDCCDELGNETSYTYRYSRSATTERFAGLKSLQIYDSDSSAHTSYQDVVVSADAGTTFSLSAWAKGVNVTESAPQALGLLLTYTDGTTQENWTRYLNGTFDWTHRSVSVTATKPVKLVRASLRLYGTGTIYFDAVQLDMQGAHAWYAADTLDANQIYYYRVVAVDPEGVRSAPSPEASTGAAPSTSTMPGLGLKGFWAYQNILFGGDSGYVNMANGNLVYAATDLVYPSRMLAMAFRRTYNAQGASTAGTLGYGWDHNFNWSLKSSTTGTPGSMILREGDGSTFTFVPRSDRMGYLTPAGSRMNLLKTGETFTLVRFEDNLLFKFDRDGKLDQIQEPNGNALKMKYNIADLLESVTGPSGEVLTLEYNSAGYISAVIHPGHTDAQPPAVHFEYDTSGDLTRVYDLEGNTVN
jgi:hypothetical protein